ncbi:hypothetical protein PRIPAC_85629 [Pristionchus pacificus]|nr:hypothetical protein PRIPAC_85629 [Pristionchus pacificus]
MVSTEHENAEYYFNRDVECIRTFFRRKFGFDSDEFPRLCEVKRRHTMDIELAASGFTKDMQKDLNRAYDEGDFKAHESDDEDEDDEEEEGGDEDVEEEESDMETIKEEDEEHDEEEVNNEKKEGEKMKKGLLACSRFDAWLDEASKQLEQVVKIEGDEHVHIVKHPNQTVPSVEEREYESDNEDKVPQLVDGNEEEVNDEEEKKEKRIRNMKRSNQTVGTRSVMSVGSTIAPEEVKRRVTMELRQNKEKTKIRAKGKQSAVSRGRKSNRETIGEYAGWDF